MFNSEFDLFVNLRADDYREPTECIDWFDFRLLAEVM